MAKKAPTIAASTLSRQARTCSSSSTPACRACAQMLVLDVEKRSQTVEFGLAALRGAAVHDRRGSRA